MAEDWLNKIRESQADFSEPEPEGLWEGIEAGLAAEDIGASAGMEPVRATDAGSSVGRTSREDSAVSRRRTVRWWWAALPAAAVAALVLLLSVPGHRDVSDDPLRTSAISELKSTDEPFDVVSREVESSAPANLLAYSGTLLASDTKAGKPSEATADDVGNASEELPKRQESSSWNNTPNDSSSETISSEINSLENSSSKTTSSENSSLETTSSENRSLETTSSENRSLENWPSENDNPVSQTRRRGLSFGLLASNVAGSRSSASKYAALYGSTVTKQIHGFSETTADFPDSQGYAGVMQSNSNNEISSTVKNWQPIQVGVSVAYSFTDRLSIESGLTYSCLISDLSSGTPLGNYDIRQTLHYIGLPLALRYDFLKIKGFSLYASAGGQMEKCVAGKTRTDYFVDGKKVSSENGRIMVEPLQWSVNAYVGAQYSFNRLVGLYVEPGAAYYFRNGSPVNCIYKGAHYRCSFPQRFSGKLHL